MQELKKRLALIGLIAILSGCNSTDALTPQVDVGGTFSSPPVTQSDLDSMSAETPPVTSSQQTAFTATGSATSTGADTPGTLDAQAQALSRNGMAQTAETPVRTQTQTQTQTALSTETAALTPAEGNGDDTIRFLPIIGAPVDAVTPLSRQLGTEARSSGLTIRSASDSSTKYILKGYFSAMNDGGKTTVVYVWDVLDGAGARLHRIQGQESVSATAADPWAAVPARTMENIARKTIQQYQDWRSTTRG